jgi:hypothetical protein
VRGKAAATLAIERAILEIVTERAPITVRGVCYALFVRKLIPSMAVNQTQRISRIMTDMRESEALNWQLIVDGSRPVERAQTWRDPNELMQASVREYRRDNWQDQPTIVELWSEKSTVQGLLAPELDELGVTFRVMKGFGSFTVVKQASVESHIAGKKTVALYIGDWDPSGLFMSEADLPQRLAEYGGRWRMRRIAIVERDHHLPHFNVATKPLDPRYRWFVQRYGRRCWELDAMNPNDLRARVRRAIWSYINRALWNRALEIEGAQTDSMREYHEGWRSRLRRP